MINHLWFFFMPLLFLPNLGFGGKTAFGTLELSDYLIFPYIVLVLIAGRKKSFSLAVNQIIPILALFVGWALLSTLLINLRYGYASDFYMRFSLLKLGKFILYGLAGILTVKALKYEDMKKFNWSLLFAGLIVGISLFITGEHSERQILQLGDALDAYKASNAISVMMAMILCYIGSAYMYKHGTSFWRKTVLYTFPFMFFGFIFSKGRGGWIAALAGFIYLIYKQGKMGKKILIILFLGILSIFSYYKFPEFQYQIDKTFWADEQYLEEYNMVFRKMDEGGRLMTWLHEAPKLINSPLFGTGFFHRGGESKLWTSGSHNFLIQIFLETGIIGGILLFFVIRRMWRQIVFFEKKGYPHAIAVQSSFIAAFTGGMTGEYFYGGIVFFTFFIVYAPIGSIPLQIPVSTKIDGLNVKQCEEVNDLQTLSFSDDAML
jgi:O-antigen ligase